MKKWQKIAFSVTGFVVILLVVVLLSQGMIGKAKENEDSFQMDGTVLVKYVGKLERVVIPDGVTAIGSACFEDNTTITNVILPSGLSEIRSNAFSGCTNLVSIIIPDSVKILDDSAFSKCSSLEEVYIGKGITDYGNGVFSDCVKLSEIEIHLNNESVCCNDGVIYSKDMTILYEVLSGRDKEFYIMPDTVSEVKPYSVWNHPTLKYINGSENLDTLVTNAFSNAPELINITIPYGLKKIQTKAISDNPRLEQIYLPSSVERIEKDAFINCSKLSIYTEDESYAHFYAKEEGIDVVFQPKITTDIAFIKKEEYLKELYDSLNPAETNQEETMVPLEELFRDEKDIIGKTYVVRNHAVVLIDPSVQVTSGEGCKWNDLLMEISDGVIPEKLFYKKKELTNIALPSSIKEIGKMAFARSGIEEIEIPDGVERIEYAAFYHCDNLTYISFPDSLTYVGEKAFEHTKWYENWLENSPDDYLIVGNGVLIAYKGDKEDFKLPENVNYICCDVPVSR